MRSFVGLVSVLVVVSLVVRSVPVDATSTDWFAQSNGATASGDMINDSNLNDSDNATYSYADATGSNCNSYGDAFAPTEYIDMNLSRTIAEIHIKFTVPCVGTNSKIRVTCGSGGSAYTQDISYNTTTVEARYAISGGTGNGGVCSSYTRVGLRIWFGGSAGQQARFYYVRGYDAVQPSVPVISAVYVCIPGTDPCDGTEDNVLKGWDGFAGGRATVRIVTAAGWTGPCDVVYFPSAAPLDAHAFGPDQLGPGAYRQLTITIDAVGSYEFRCTNGAGYDSWIIGFQLGMRVEGSSNPAADEECAATDAACWIRQLMRTQSQTGQWDIGSLLVTLFMPSVNPFETIYDAAVEREPFATMVGIGDFVTELIDYWQTELSSPPSSDYEWCVTGTIPLFHGFSGVVPIRTYNPETVGTSFTETENVVYADRTVTFCLPFYVVQERFPGYATDVRPVLGWVVELGGLLLVLRSFYARPVVTG